MRTLLAGCAVVAMFGLTAAQCTPEEEAAVIADYAARMTAEAETERAPMISAEPGCDLLTITAEGWPDGSLMYVSVGGTPPLHVPFDGSTTADLVVGPGFGGSLDHYSYSVTINDEVVLPNTDGPPCYASAGSITTTTPTT